MDPPASVQHGVIGTLSYGKMSKVADFTVEGAEAAWNWDISPKIKEREDGGTDHMVVQRPHPTCIRWSSWAMHYPFQTALKNWLV